MMPRSPHKMWTRQETRCKPLRNELGSEATQSQEGRRQNSDCITTSGGRWRPNCTAGEISVHSTPFPSTEPPSSYAQPHMSIGQKYLTSPHATPVSTTPPSVSATHTSSYSLPGAMDATLESDAARVLTHLFVKGTNPSAADISPPAVRVTEDGVRLPMSPPESPRDLPHSSDSMDATTSPNGRKRPAVEEAEVLTPGMSPEGDKSKYKLKRARNNEAVRKCRIKKKQERESKQVHLQRLEASKCPPFTVESPPRVGPR